MVLIVGGGNAVGESISVQTMMGVMIMSLAWCACLVLILVTTGLAELDYWSAKFQSTSQIVTNGIMMDMQGCTDVSGATLYKFTKKLDGKISSIHIKFKDGSVSDDVRRLLKKAGSRFSVEVEDAHDGFVEINAEEVQ